MTCPGYMMCMSLAFLARYIAVVKYKLLEIRNESWDIGHDAIQEHLNVGGIIDDVEFAVGSNAVRFSLGPLHLGKIVLVEFALALHGDDDVYPFLCPPARVGLRTEHGLCLLPDLGCVPPAGPTFEHEDGHPALVASEYEYGVPSFAPSTLLERVLGSAKVAMDDLVPDGVDVGVLGWGDEVGLY